jgi:predicted esterase
VRSCDPCNYPVDFWRGKNILAIGGGQDKLVPPGEGGTIKFIDALKAHGMGERVQLKIDEDAGHEVTPRMVGWMVEWLWENVLKQD